MRATYSWTLIAAVGLIPGCLDLEEPLDPGGEVDSPISVGTGMGIVVLNGLDPVSYYDPTVQSNLPALMNGKLAQSTVTKTLASSAAGLEYLYYAVFGALDANSSLDIIDTNGGRHSFSGLLGMAKTEWPAGTMSQGQKERNAAYWGASLNLKNLNVLVSMVGPFAPMRSSSGQVDPKYDFFEAVYFVGFEGGRPITFAVPSSLYWKQCGDEQQLAAGRCGRVSPRACGLVPIRKKAEDVCTFYGQMPVSCTYGGVTYKNPIGVYFDAAPCDR